MDVPSPAGSGSVKGYLVRPASAASTASLPAVLVIHENRGLNPHIEDIARRLALDGFMAFAPDALTPGRLPGDEDRARALFAQLDRAKAEEDFIAAGTWLRARADSKGKLGAVGFCWGSTWPPYEAALKQAGVRHAALRRGGGQASLEPHRGVLQAAARLSGRRRGCGESRRLGVTAGS